jgi:hypothetical protein
MPSRYRGLSLVAVVAALVVSMVSFVDRGQSVGQTGPTGPTDAAQGQYIIALARCTGCHAVNLGGVPANPANPADPAWVPRPKIAGLPMFSNDADAVKFFETGLLPDGSKPKAPMPGYLFHHSDALALTAYLRSLK